MNPKLISTKTTNIYNHKGSLKKLITKNDNHFKGFGELYTTKIKYNKVKAWKKHNKMTANIFILTGKVQFIFPIMSKNSDVEFHKIILSSNGNNHLIIPPKYIFGFKGLYKNESILINFSNIKHNSIEVKNYKLNFFDYKWN